MKHKYAIVDCVVQSWNGRRQLVVRISRAGEDLPPIRFKDVLVTSTNANGKEIKLKGNYKADEILGETGDPRGRTAYIHFDLFDSDQPAQVVVSRGPEMAHLVIETRE